MRRSCLALALLASGCARPPRVPLARAAEYLWNQQAGDGGWHSHTYGLLRSGQALTPFVLDALLQIPAEIGTLPQSKLDRGLDFIRNHTRQDGALGMADPGIPDYPNYSTALAVSTLCRARRPGWEAQVQPMVGYLRAQQFTEQNGWSPADPVYGAWGMGGGRRTPPDTGHVDISMTRYVLEALRAAGTPSSDPLFAHARTYLQRCQNFDPNQGGLDGGFFFSTTEADTNKAGQDGPRFRSYGSTTADGILALLAAGSSPDDPHIVAGEKWLLSHHRDMEVPGFVGAAYQRWPRGLTFYYSSASMQAFRALRAAPGSSVAEGLKRVQHIDGSWANPENLVKEDDPLIATPFAIRALLASQ